jgi:hypothetical protein
VRTVLSMAHGSEEFHSLSQQVSAAGTAFRDAVDTFGTVRTAQLVENADGSYDVVFRYKGSWDDFQRTSADAKADFLTTHDTAYSSTGPGERVGSRTASWGNHNPVETSRPTQIMGGEYRPGYAFQVDHGVDLQLGGIDRAPNFRWLESSVNGSEGAQLDGLARRFNVTDGTVFNTFRFADRGAGAGTFARTTSWIGSPAVAAR